MPASVKIIVKNVVYLTPILNQEMENKNAEINAKKEEIKSLQDHLTTAINELNTLQNQFMALYIQATGSFPPG